MTKTTAVATTPKTKAKTLEALLRSDAVVEQLRLALPKHITAERMARIALTELRRNPKLGQCTPESVLGALMQSAQLGLEPGPMGLAYLIPYKTEVQLQVGYKGLVALAWRSKEIASIQADTVCERDFFEFERGTKAFLSHRPSNGDRGPITHVYAVVDVKGGGSLFEVMTVTDVDAHRAHYSKSTKDSPWDSAWDQMARKTVIKRVLKLAPVSAELLQAVNLDDMAEVGASQAIRHEIDVTPAKAATAKLAEAAKESPAEEKLGSQTADTGKDTGAPHDDDPAHQHPMVDVTCKCGAKDWYPIGSKLPCTSDCGLRVVVTDDGEVSFINDKEQGKGNLGI